MTASSSTASSTASWRRPATRPAPARGGSGKKLKAEFNASRMCAAPARWPASQSPNSADSQFFICFADSPLPRTGQYTVWGQVIDGMDNVDKIKRGEPVKDPDKIVSMKVAADAA